MYNILNKLSGTCNRVYQYNHGIHINVFDNLNIISSQSGAGKNTLMKGIMMSTPPEENFMVLTESGIDNTYRVLSKEIMQCSYSGLDIESVLMEFEQTECNNLFIEQYISCDSKSDQFGDLNYLRKYSETYSKSIYICVHLPRQKV